MVALTINVLSSKLESTRVLMKVALTPHLLGPMMESGTLMVPLSNLSLGSTMAGETSMVELTNLATDWDLRTENWLERMWTVSTKE